MSEATTPQKSAAASSGKKWKMDGAKKALETSKKKAGAPKAPKAKEANLMTFAFRLTKDESAAIHKAAGPGKASEFARSILAAAAKGDVATIRGILGVPSDRR